MAHAQTPPSKDTKPRSGIPGLDVCKKHQTEPISYYCTTCEVPSCPVCIAEDHPEPEHSRMELDAAVEERLENLRKLTANCEIVKSEVDTNLAQGDAVLLDLDSTLEEINEQMRAAEESALRDFEDRLRRCREHSMNRLQEIKEQRYKTVTGHIATLTKDEDRLSSAIRMANQVTNSATKYEVALTYATIARKMERLQDVKAVTISTAHAKLAFKAHESSKEMLIADDLGNFILRPGMRKSKVSFSDQAKPPTSFFDPAVLARHGVQGKPPIEFLDPSVLARHGVKLEPPPEGKPVQNILKDAKQNENNIISDDSTKPVPAEAMLEFAHEFGREEGDGKLYNARGVAISPTSNDIAVADHDARQVKVYSSEGEFRFSVDTKQLGNTSDVDSKPWDIAVSSEGEYLVTDKTPCVKVYDATGKSICRFPAISPDPDKQRSDVDDVGLYCIATDAKGRVLVGAGNFYVSIHSAARDDCHISSISVRIPPGFMTTTSQGHIIIGSGSQQKVMVINQAGEVLHTLKPPTGMSTWRLRGVCCSSDDDIYVANQGTGKNAGKNGVHRYKVTGEHMGCITNDVKAPVGISILANKGIVLAEKSVVKIFQWHDTDS